jgi:Xaa-Pro aminopeptidase
MNQNDYSAVFITDNLTLKQAQNRYLKRRKKIMELIKHPLFLIGPNKEVTYNFPWINICTPIYQDHFLLFCTGINQLSTALFLNPVNHEMTLFLPKLSANEEFWNGKKLFYSQNKQYLEKIKKLTGFDHIRDISKAYSYVVEQMKKYIKQPLGIVWHKPKDAKKPLNNYLNHSKKQLEIRFVKQKINKNRLVNIGWQLWDIYLPQDKYSLKNLINAHKVTRKIFVDTLHILSKFKYENEIAGHIIGEIRKQTHFNESFPVIVASGKNATTLHYTKNNCKIKKTDMLLLDFGLQWHMQCTDISRTIPVSGIFNPLQRLLYQILLEAQNLVEEKVQPGITIEELNRNCWQYINQQLQEKILDKQGTYELKYQHTPHNVAHLIGIYVHDGDPYGEYRKLPLKPGWLISNEPGIYGHFQITHNGKKYQEEIGLRLEDNLLITKKGCLNLSSKYPKTIAALEKIMRK